MFRYRCPHCRQVLQALEIRAGKTTICSKCSKPLTIPADPSEWLTDRGESDATISMLKSKASPHELPVVPSSDTDQMPHQPGYLEPIFVGSPAPLPDPTAEDIHLPPLIEDEEAEEAQSQDSGLISGMGGPPETSAQPNAPPSSNPSGRVPAPPARTQPPTPTTILPPVDRANANGSAPATPPPGSGRFGRVPSESPRTQWRAHPATSVDARDRP